MTAPYASRQTYNFSEPPYRLPTPRVPKPPIHNPYDKFTQPEFDAWIGGITGALKQALGQEDETTLRIPHSDLYPTPMSSNEHESPERFESPDEQVDDSFAEIKARRVVGKGKARDPREGPGFGTGDKDRPIDLVSDSEEEQEEIGISSEEELEQAEVEIMAGVRRESEEEEEEEEVESEDWEEGEESSDEEAPQWIAGESSAQAQMRHAKHAASSVGSYEDELLSDQEYSGEEDRADEDFNSTGLMQPEETEEIILISSDLEDDNDEGNDKEDALAVHESGDEDEEPAVFATLNQDRVADNEEDDKYRSGDSDNEAVDGEAENSNEDEYLEGDGSPLRNDSGGEAANQHHTVLPIAASSSPLRALYDEDDIIEEILHSEGTPGLDGEHGWGGPNALPVDIIGTVDLTLPAAEDAQNLHQEPVTGEVDEDGPSLHQNQLDTASPKVYEILDDENEPTPSSPSGDKEEEFNIQSSTPPTPNGRLAGTADNQIVYNVDMYDDNVPEPEVQPMDEDTSFPPHESFSDPIIIGPPLDMPDVWAGPRAYAEDYYSGGDVRLNPSHELTADNLGSGDQEDYVGMPLGGDSVLTLTTDPATALNKPPSSDDVAELEGHVQTVEKVGDALQNSVESTFEASSEPQRPQQPDLNFDGLYDDLDSVPFNEDSINEDNIGDSWEFPGFLSEEVLAVTRDYNSYILEEATSAQADLSLSAMLKSGSNVLSESPHDEFSLPSLSEAPKPVENMDLTQKREFPTPPGSGEGQSTSDNDLQSSANEPYITQELSDSSHVKEAQGHAELWTHVFDRIEAPMSVATPHQAKTDGIGEVDPWSIVIEHDHMILMDIDQKDTEERKDIGPGALEEPPSICVESPSPFPPSTPTIEDQPQFESQLENSPEKIITESLDCSPAEPDNSSGNTAHQPVDVSVLNHNLPTPPSELVDDHIAIDVIKPEFDIGKISEWTGSPISKDKDTTEQHAAERVNQDSENNLATCVEDGQSGEEIHVTPKAPIIGAISINGSSVIPEETFSDPTDPIVHSNQAPPQPLPPTSLESSSSSPSITSADHQTPVSVPDETKQSPTLERDVTQMDLQLPSRHENILMPVIADTSVADPTSGQQTPTIEPLLASNSENTVTGFFGLSPPPIPSSVSYPMRVVMRKATAPILFSDPFPYSLSTPSDFSYTKDMTDEISEEDTEQENSMSSSSTFDKEGEEKETRGVSDDNDAPDIELRYPSEPLQSPSSLMKNGKGTFDPRDKSNNTVAHGGSNSKSNEDPFVVENHGPGQGSNGVQVAPSGSSSNIANAEQPSAPPLNSTRSPTPPADELPSILIVKPKPAFPRLQTLPGDTSEELSDLEDSPARSKPSRPPKRKRSESLQHGFSPITRSMASKKPEVDKPLATKAPPSHLPIKSHSKQLTKSKSRSKGESNRLLLDKRSESGGSSSSKARRQNDNTSRESSIASSVPSEKSSVGHSYPSPTLNKGNNQQPPATVPPPLPPVLMHNHSHTIRHHHGLTTTQPPRVQAQVRRASTWGSVGEPSTAKPTSTPQQAPHRQNSYTSSPVTRSHCRYHKISIPQEEDDVDGPRVYFLIPGCSLGDRELIDEEDILDHGDATHEDSLRMVKDMEAWGIHPYIIGVLRMLAGVDTTRQQDFYYLPQPGEEPPQKAKETKPISEKALPPKHFSRNALESNAAHGPPRTPISSTSPASSGAPISTTSASTTSTVDSMPKRGTKRYRTSDLHIAGDMEEREHREPKKLKSRINEWWRDE